MLLYSNEKAAEDFTYASRCYTLSPSGSCKDYVLSSLPYKEDANAPCPFAPELCYSAFDNLCLDTEDLDSVLHLGLNAGPQFTIRLSTHCAPLTLDDRTSVIYRDGSYVKAVNSTRRYARYHYGTWRDNDWVTELELDDVIQAADTLSDYKVA